ncbi:MAG TPA: alpha/beta hydrolase [Myxococcales bacterium]
MIVPLSAVWFLAHRAFLRMGFRSHELRDGEHVAHLYEREGKGSAPPVLLVHGLGGNAAGFLPILRGLLRASRRVLLLEMPGHGRARLAKGARPAGVRDFVSMLQVAMDYVGEPLVLAGSSLGGAVVLAAAAAQPDRVRGVIGLNPAGAPLAGEARLSVVRAFRGGSMHAALEMNKKLYARPPRLAFLVARGLAQHWSSLPVQHLVGEMQSDLPGIPAETLRSIRVPALILWGEADGLLPPSFPAFFEQFLPVERMPAVGHLPMQERGKEVSARMARFLRELPS